MNHIKDAPKDGTRILLCYFPLHFNRWRPKGSRFIEEGYRPTKEPKWEECFWDKDHIGTRRSPEPGGAYEQYRGRWTPWCGNPQVKSTQTISEEHIVGWLPVPEA